ncbi:MAG: MotA/TolQ/ExbB proton channel family protein, partial [Rubripirellula sp.]
MNDHDRPSSRSRLVPRSPANRQHTMQLASRVLPLIILGLGATWWMLSMRPAMGQFPNQPNFRGQQYQTNQGYTTTAVPTIPSAAIPTDGQAPVAEGEEAGSKWKLPGFVTKISQGGWLMIPLGVCSLIVFALSLERLIALRRGRVIPRPFVRRFTECVEDGQLSYDEATELCEEFDCPVAEVFRAAVRRWGRPMFEVEQAVMDAGDRVADGLKRFLRVFHAISNVAPLIGLLGTV